MMEAEERPVADRIEGVPLPPEAETVAGHDAALQNFLENRDSGRLHHAWLLSGPRGIGKATLAFHLAKILLSNAGQGGSDIETNVHRQVAHGAHPGLLHLTRPWDEKAKRFKQALSVDEIRKTQQFYGLTSATGNWRITIVDAADDMNSSAANALLKILEEPPKRSLFFVITHSPGRLLPTIRSRCQSLPLSPLDDETVTQLLDSFDLETNSTRLAKAAKLSGGSVRQALRMLDGDALKAWQAFEKLHGASGGAGDWLAVHKLADLLARRGQEQAFTQFTEMVCNWIADRARQHDDRRLTVLAGWSDVWEKANRSVRLADAYNLDRKQVILSLFSDLFAHNSRM
ncbi:MAG: DNA polymerase III subunit delta' [Rhizobiaceae bacterium]